MCTYVQYVLNPERVIGLLLGIFFTRVQTRTIFGTSWNVKTLIKSDGGTDWDIRVGFVANVYGTAGQRVRDVNSASGVINDTLQ